MFSQAKQSAAPGRCQYVNEEYLGIFNMLEQKQESRSSPPLMRPTRKPKVALNCVILYKLWLRWIVKQHTQCFTWNILYIAAHVSREIFYILLLMFHVKHFIHCRSCFMWNIFILLLIFHVKKFYIAAHVSRETFCILTPNVI